METGQSDSWQTVLKKPIGTSKIMKKKEIIEEESSPSPKSDTIKTPSKRSRRNRHHPFYYQYGVEQLDGFDSEFTRIDVEEWAAKDWEDYEIELEQCYGLCPRNLERFKTNWFYHQYGSNYYFKNALYYDFPKYQRDLVQYFFYRS